MKIVSQLLRMCAFERVRNANEEMLVSNGADKLKADR